MEKEDSTINDTIKVNFIPLGNVKTLNKFYHFNKNELIYSIKSKIKKTLKITSDQDILLYCNSFLLNPDQCLKDLYECFGIGEALTFYYTMQEIYG